MIYIYIYIYTHIYDTYIVKTYFGFNACYSKLMHQDMYECYTLNFSWIANQYDCFILAPNKNSWLRPPLYLYIIPKWSSMDQDIGQHERGKWDL